MDLDDLLLNPTDLPPEKITLLVHRVRTLELEVSASKRREEELAALVQERNTALDYMQGHVNELRLQLALAGCGVSMMKSSSSPAPATQDGQQQNSNNNQNNDDDDDDCKPPEERDEDDDPACQQLYQELCGLCVSGDGEHMVGNAVRQGRRGSLGRLSNLTHQYPGSNSNSNSNNNSPQQPHNQQQTASGSPFSTSLHTSPLMNGAPGAASGSGRDSATATNSNGGTPMMSGVAGGGGGTPQQRGGNFGFPGTPPLNGGGGNVPPPPCGFALSPQAIGGGATSARVTPQRSNSATVGSNGAFLAAGQQHQQGQRVAIGGTHHPMSAKSSSSSQSRAVPTPPLYGQGSAAQAAPRGDNHGGRGGSREFKRYRAESPVGDDDE